MKADSRMSALIFTLRWISARDDDVYPGSVNEHAGVSRAGAREYVSAPARPGHCDADDAGRESGDVHVPSLRGHARAHAVPSSAAKLRSPLAPLRPPRQSSSGL